MKKGIYYFLKMKNPIIIIRGLFVVTGISLFMVPSNSVLFEMLLVFFAITIAANIITMTVREPSEKEVREFIDETILAHAEDIKASVNYIGNSRVHTLKAFSQDKKLNLSRQMGYDVVYSTLVSNVAIEQKETITVSSKEISLLKADEGHELVRWDVEKGSRCISVAYEDYDEDFKVSKVTLTNVKTGEGYTFLAKDDFHLRGFIEVLDTFGVTEKK